eukprot:GSMAST32.ASY1.ANO1.2518.1 assembled CDS
MPTQKEYKALKKAAGIRESSGECVKVIVRVRPIFGREVTDGHAAVSIHNPQNPSAPPKVFTFDHVYGPNSKQIDIYNRTASPLVDCVLEGFNGTIFAYGQTGSGKTHTMVGYGDDAGLNKTKDKKFLVRASFLEIYNEDVRDLLSNNPTNKLQVKENVDSGVFVKGLTQIKGDKLRTTGATAMNLSSSRSHSIFTVTVKFRVGKLNLVDLAGSERQSKTHATGKRLKEATKINLSHIPYRDSKLTRLLQDSLGGNTKTETVSTLRYANRAKNIKNKPKINEDPKDAMLREFQDEIIKLRKEIEMAGGGSSEESSEGELIEMVEKVVTVRKGIEKEKMDALKAQMKQQELEMKSAAKEDKKRLRAAQKATEKDLFRLQQKELLAKKLAAVEEKLKRTKAELRERREAEHRMIKNLAEQEEAEILMQQDYANLHEEARGKTAKLKKLYAKYQQQRSEIKDVQEEFKRERENILESIRELNKELKLNQFILNYFIPTEQLDKIEAWALFNEEDDEWRIRHIEYSGNNQKRYKRSAKAKKLLNKQSSRPQTSRRSKSNGGKSNQKNDQTQTVFGPPLSNPYVVYNKNEVCGYSLASDSKWSKLKGATRKKNKKSKKTRR